MQILILRFNSDIAGDSHLWTNNVGKGEGTEMLSFESVTWAVIAGPAHS